METASKGLQSVEESIYKMIPKIIHYCWFGGSSKPEIVKKCISSWHKYCPDWEIIEWNESNYDVTAHDYTKEAYEAKKWAFVTDFARLDIVATCGGVYMDTDVELLHSIDDLLQYDAFYAFESDRNLASGLGIGAAAAHPSVFAMLKYYEGRHFVVKGKLDQSPCPAKNTEAMVACYPCFVRNGKAQCFDNVKILSFAEYAQFAVHHGAASWVDGPKPKEHVFKDTKLKRWLRKPEHFDFIEGKLGKRAADIYTFVVYDLMEMGLLYYVKRFIAKRFGKLE